MEGRDVDHSLSLMSLEEGCLSIVNRTSAGDHLMDIETVNAPVAAAAEACMESNMQQEHHDDADASDNTSGIIFEKLSVDDLLQKWVGECGRAQLWHFVLVSLAWTIHGLQTLVMVFADRQPSWQCRPSPSLQSVTSSSSSSFYNAAALNLTGTLERVLFQQPDQEPMKCSPTAALCSMDSSLWEWVGQKGVSTVSEWNLVCGDEYKRGLVQCVFFIGGLLGNGVFGSLSDSILGRKGALALACSATAISGLFTAAAPNYWAYVIMRGVTGLCTGGVGLSSFVLATEPVGPSRRGQMGMSAFYFFSLGVMALPVFAFYISSWRLLYVAAAIPAIIYCAMILPFVCESPRWYLIQGRLEEAMAVLRNFATLNGKSVPAWVGLATDHKELLTDHVETLALLAAGNPNSISGLNLLNNLSSPTTDPPPQLSARDQELSTGYSHGVLEPSTLTPNQGTAAATKFSGTLWDVFKCSGTRKSMLIMIVIWFNCSVVYYGINLNVVNIGFDLYLSVFTNGLVEIPAYAITALLLQKLGRRNLLFSLMLLGGVCCLAGSLLSVQSHTNNIESPLLQDSTVIADRFNLVRITVPAAEFGLDKYSTSAISKFGDYSSYYYYNSSSFSSSSTARWLAFARLLCGVIGIFGIAGAYNLIYIYTLELFPTVVRNAALGLTSQAGGIGAVIAPTIVALDHYNSAIPFSLFAAAALMGALLGLWLPETLNQPLWETLEGMMEKQATTTTNSNSNL